MVDAELRGLGLVFHRALPRAAMCLAAFVVVLLAAALPLAAFAHQLSAGLVYILIFVPFTAVGALLAVRVPGNPIGWLFLLVSLGALLGLDAGAYAIRACMEPGATACRSRVSPSRLRKAGCRSSCCRYRSCSSRTDACPGAPGGGRCACTWPWRLFSWVGIGVHDLGAFTDARIGIDSSG